MRSDTLESFRFCRVLGIAGLWACTHLLAMGAAHGGLIFEETFNYADGNLTGQNGGTGFTGAWTGNATGNIQVKNGAAYSNPNASVQQIGVGRNFTGFSETEWTLNLDYSVIVNNEGTYDFLVSLFDSNSQEVIRIGTWIDQDGAGEFHVIRLGADRQTGSQAHQKLGATETYSDTMSLTAFVSGNDIELHISSAYFTNLNGTVISRTLSSPIDFSSGGELRISKDRLDSMHISVDNVSLTAVPEPGTVGLIIAGLGLWILRRKAA